MVTWTRAGILTAGLLALLFGLFMAIRPERAWEAASVPPKENDTGAGSPTIRLTTLFGIFCGLVALLALGRFIWAYIEASPAGRAQLFASARTFGFLFVAMIAGMLASVVVAAVKAQSESINVHQLLVPLACSALVFGSFWAGLTNRAAGPMELLAAFESGFCWELLLNRYTQPAAAPSRKPTAANRAVIGRG